MAKLKWNGFDWLKSVLKTGTYFIAGTASTAVVQAIQGGMNLEDALKYGLGIGLIAGLKNVFKHLLKVDLDLMKLKK